MEEWETKSGSNKGQINGKFKGPLKCVITPWRAVFLEKIMVLSQSRNSPHFMEPAGSLTHSQEPATCPYPEPVETSPFPRPTPGRSNLILSPLSPHLRLGLPSRLLTSGFLTKTLYAPLPSPMHCNV
jgi:hypothetical protein